MSTTAPSPVFTDIIVVIHGIGKQQRYSTVRSVATRLACSRLLSSKSGQSPVAPQPLGYFHADVSGDISVRLVDDPMKLSGGQLAGIGVAEVFWADIPAEVVDEGNTLEETKGWARTVVARAQALCMNAKARGATSVAPPDFHLASEVLDEIIDTVYVAENLTFLAEKAGLFTFDLRKVLEDYLGDVQVVAEFGGYRRKIVRRFHAVMEDVYQRWLRGHSERRLHIVAHSEGTVVSFLGLLQAMSGQVPPRDEPPGAGGMSESRAPELPDWLLHVRGYMTIGSPIDKHLLLWPRMWEGLNPAFANKRLDAGQISWRNYYDYGDPVGFSLDTARRWLELNKVEGFEFCNCPKCRHDVGFARYLLPGKAHNDYWDDRDVFEHFVCDVVKPGIAGPKRPSSKASVAWLSPLLPYLLSFVVLFTAVFILYKAVTTFTHPERDPLVAVALLEQIGLTPTVSVSSGHLVVHALSIAALIAGTTALARLPRLAAGGRWKAIAFAGFLLGCLAYVVGVTPDSRREIGAVFGWAGPNGPTWGVLGLALVVGLLGWALSRSGKHTAEDRRHWLLRQGMRPLLLCGALGIAAVVGSQVFPDFFHCRSTLTVEQRAVLSHDQITSIDRIHFTRDELDQLLVAKDRDKRLERLTNVEPLLASTPPVWPVLLATAGFLYLWWLGALLFDLGFVWHRYVRNSIINIRLDQWAGRGHLPVTNATADRGRCRNPKLKPQPSAASVQT